MNWRYLFILDFSRVLVIYTGGTIGMKHTTEHGYIPVSIYTCIVVYYYHQSLLLFFQSHRHTLIKKKQLIFTLLPAAKLLCKDTCQSRAISWSHAFPCTISDWRRAAFRLSYQYRSYYSWERDRSSWNAQLNHTCQFIW